MYWNTRFKLELVHCSSPMSHETHLRGYSLLQRDLKIKIRLNRAFLPYSQPNTNYNVRAQN